MKKRLLPIWGGLIGLFAGLHPVQAQVPLPSGATPYSQAFNTLPASGTLAFAQNSTLPGWYAERSGTGATLTANNGSSNAGGLYSYGTDGNPDRALGSLGSGNAAAGNFTFGLRLRNESSQPVTSLTIRYTGEQWRNSAAAAQTVTFSYRISATALTTTEPGGGEVPSGFTAVPDLNFTSPVTGGTAGALDGNAAANRQEKTFTLTGISIPVNGEILLRWYDPDHTGSDHGLAIDEVSVTGPGTTNGQASVSVNANFNTFTTSAGTPSAPQSYTLTGRNITATDNLVVTATNGFEVDFGNGFKTEETVPGSRFVGNASIVGSVRLNRSTVGAVTGILRHQVGSNIQSFSVLGNVTAGSGTGFATIADARSRPDNTPLSALPGGRIAGRVTASNQFGTTAFIQDATGGIAIFSATFAGGVQIGDSVQVTGGTITSFNQLKQVGGTVTFTNIGPVGAPVPKVVPVNQLANYEGQLVTVSDARIRPLTTVASPTPRFVFTPDANFGLSDATGSAQVRIVRTTNLPGYQNPGSTIPLTGIVGRFRTDIQVQPRFVADVSGTTRYEIPEGNLNRSQTLDVAAWNIEWLGNTGNGPTNENQQFANAIQVINSLQSDVVVLEEISSPDAINRLVAGLPGYQGNCSPFVSNNPGHEIPPNPATPTTVPGDAQRVCILYKSDVLTLVAQRPLLERAQPLPGYPADPSNFWASGRYPYLWTFTTTANGQTVRLNVVGVHAKANTDQPDSYNRRRYDARVLYDSLNAQFPNELLLVAGDFNDDIDLTVATDPGITSTESTYKPFVDDPARYTFVTRPLSDNGFRTFLTSDNVIDHILVSNKLAPAFLPESVGVGTPFTFIPDYGNTTSDHLPVVARFNLTQVATGSQPLALLLPTYDCTTGRLEVRTQGGNGQPIEYRIAGLRHWSTDAVFAVPTWQRENTTFTIQARQWDGAAYREVQIQFGASCQPVTVPPGGNQPLSLLSPAFSCGTGELRLQPSGGNGQPIEYRIAGLRDWSTSPVFTVPTWQRSGVTFTVEARQTGGGAATQTFSTTCTAGARLDAETAASEFSVSVLSNPFSDVLRLQVAGPAGRPLSLELVDVYGRTVTQHPMKTTGQQQVVTLKAEWAGPGLYLLRARSDEKVKLIRVLKQ
ncbi:endonuclease/exonuclease/phosphatase family protein [Tellurirhabdus rosea]|uniref:endonuclease/exonuclease/phosphatase family protein n=1 Tax=Tellurirhabdus rosea TaxID=2674997 RepID=UPI00225ABDFC|nr:endonuclease/exonuclease/phosphatase family protein [Tellurirhabdus rosea]